MALFIHSEKQVIDRMGHSGHLMSVKGPLPNGNIMVRYPIILSYRDVVGRSSWLVTDQRKSNFKTGK